MFRGIFRISFLAVLALGAGMLAASAQEPKAPDADLFVGYSYLHFEDGAGVHGFDVSATGHVNRWFGLTGEASGHYESGDAVHFVLGGPRFTVRTAGNRVEPFAHALAGATFFNSSPAFAMAIGGGVDVKVNDKIAIRAIQADYTPVISDGYVLHSARISTGVVFRFD